MSKTKKVRNKRRDDLWTVISYLLVGLFFLLPGVRNCIRYWGVENEGIATMGNITAVNKRGGDGPRVSYEYEAEGHSYKGHSLVDHDYAEYAEDNIGGEIPIIYYKNYPRLSAIDGFNEGFLVAVLIGAGGFFFLIGVSLLTYWIWEGWKGRLSQAPETALNEP